MPGCPGREASAMEIDTDRIDEAVLALLYLGLHDRWRVWKGFDWDALDRLSPTPPARPSRSCSPRRGCARPSGCSWSCSPPAARRGRGPGPPPSAARGAPASRAVDVGNPRGEAELLQLADVPPLEVHLGPGLAARPQEHDPLVLQPAAACHVGVAAGKRARDAVHVLDLPAQEPVPLRLGRHATIPSRIRSTGAGRASRERHDAQAPTPAASRPGPASSRVAARRSG